MEPQDVLIGKLKSEDVGRPFLRGQQALPSEASSYEDGPISTYEEKSGIPYTAMKLGYGDKFAIDPQVEMKVRAIDEHIRMLMQEEGLRDSPMGYQTILARMGGKLAESLESAKNHNNMKSLLDNLFMQVSFANGKSSKTYLSEYSKKNSEQRVSKLLGQLGKTLTTLQNFYGT